MILSFLQKRWVKVLLFKLTDGPYLLSVDGEVIMAAKTGHAVGLKSNNGAEVLIHIGMDTVNMNGEGFNVLVKEGQKVKCW